MPIEVEAVAYGHPAAEALCAAVSHAKGGDPLAPVVVVVPSNHVGVAVRRQLASGALGPVAGRGAGLAAVTFLTVYRLAELLGAADMAASGRRPVSTPVIAAALRGALGDDPGLFAPVADHPSTVMALVAAYKELRDVTDAAADRVAAGSVRAADVVRLCRHAHSSLQPGWYDEEDLVSAAIEAVEAGATPLAGLGSVVVHLPERLSRHGGLLLRAFGAAGDVHIVAGTTGVPDADVDVVRSLHRVRGAAPPPPPTVDPLTSVDAARTCIVTTSDADEEVRAAVRAVVDAVVGGTSLERIAILHATPEPYARLVHDQLAVAGIATNGAAVVPLTGRLVARTLLGLLQLPEAGFRRDDVFAWLAGAPIRHGGRPVPVAAWERLSRAAGVVAGRQQWDELLARLAAELRAEAEVVDDDPDGPPWAASQRRDDAARADALRDFALSLIDELAAAAERPVPWAQLAGWARRLVRRLVGGDGVRAQWPTVEQKAAERVDLALGRLGCLDQVDGPAPLDLFARTLEVELDADLGRFGRMGEGVLVGSLPMGAGLDLDLVVVLGLAEGTLPARVADDSLLPDDDRRRGDGELALRADGVGRQHHHLLAALAGAHRQVLCIPRGDLRRSSLRVPSRWACDVATALAGVTVSPGELLAGRHPWLRHVPSFDAGVRQVAFPATEQEHRLRFLLAAESPALSSADGGPGDPVLVAAAAVVRARRSTRFTRFDGNLAGLDVPSPLARPTSATRLEQWAACPFAYFARSVLGVEEVDNPEDRLTISAVDSGSLVHGVLEAFLAEVLRRPPDQRPGPDDAWTDDDRRRLLAIAAEACDRYEHHGLTGRPIFWRRDRKRITDDLVAFLARDDDIRRSRRTRPVAAELPFGLPGAPVGAVEAPVSGGRTVRFRGRADRVDVSDGGALHVIDYKTGSPSAYLGLSSDEPVAAGTRLQLVVYGLAARRACDAPDAPVRADYWFVTRRGDFKPIGYEVTDDVVDHFSTTVGAVVDGIEAGVFPNFPKDTSTTPWVTCPYCDPDGLGVADLQRQLQRKAGDPALAGFLALVGAEGSGDD